jgi:GNAT superfamily N-acetyltransferase
MTGLSGRESSVIEAIQVHSARQPTRAGCDDVDVAQSMGVGHPKGMMDGQHRLRSATAADAGFLLDMLVEAVNWHPERQLSRSTVAADPALARYIDGWSRPNDLGVIAEAASGPIGAAWLRVFTADDPGYGYLADDVPELSMAVAAAWRGCGVGRSLLQEIGDRARSAGYRAISLSVERANFAHRLYTSEGYQVVERGADSDTMVKELPPNR